jgi:hypothetical protein
MLICGTISLAGCAPNLTAAFVYCQVERPITWSQHDTDGTIAGVKEHNAVWHSLCPTK